MIIWWAFVSLMLFAVGRYVGRVDEWQDVIDYLERHPASSVEDVRGAIVADVHHEHHVTLLHRLFKDA